MKRYIATFNRNTPQLGCSQNLHNRGSHDCLGNKESKSNRRCLSLWLDVAQKC